MSWFCIGSVKANQFSPNAYQHPIWNSGAVDAATLKDLPDSIIVIMNNELHIGRSTASSRGAVRTIAKDGVCLHVQQVERRSSPGDDTQYVWIAAVKVTC